MLFHKPGKLEQFYKETTTLRTVNNIWSDTLSFKDQFVLELLLIKSKNGHPLSFPRLYFTIVKQLQADKMKS